MESKYLGIIKEKDFVSWDMSDQVDYLVKNNLFELKSYLSLNPKSSDLVIGEINAYGNSSNNREECIPKDILLVDFYEFILDIYEGGLKGASFIFFTDFDSITFGKSKKKKNEYASIQFRNIFEEICPKEYWYLTRDNNANGAIRLGSVFKSLKQKQEMDVINLKKERNLIVQFLIGNRSFFNRELFETNKTIIDVIKFEANLITLLALNKEFQFEKDNCFSPKLKADLLYDAFESKIDVDVVRFIDECINKIKDKHHSWVVALYRCLICFKKMDDITETVFREGINNTYNLNLSRLKVSESAEKKHPERLQFYKEKWLSFSKSDS